MKKILTDIQDLFILENPVYHDLRGAFEKPFSSIEYKKIDILNQEFKEFYYSVNKNNVLRGMHFQTPPFDHQKLVYVSRGVILDVMLDLRNESATYGKYFSIEIDDKQGLSLFIPRGVAHGFLSKAEDTIVNYAQTTCYAKENDCGLRYDSFGFDWGIDCPIISERDISFPSFINYKTVF